jgi:hypothetical protein
MGKKSKKPDKADQKYLTTGLLLSAGGLGLALLTYVIWLFGGIEAFAYRILLLVPIGAVVLLIGCFRTVSEKGTGTFCSADSAKRASPRRFAAAAQS